MSDMIMAPVSEPGDELRDGRRKNWFWDNNCIFDLGLSCYAIVVRLYLARCAGENRVAWPSLSNIAAHCGISRKTAKRAIDELIARGLLAKEARVTDLGDYTSNIYTLREPGPGEFTSMPSGEGGRVPQTLPCNEMPGVGYHRPYLGSDRPYVGSEVHSKNTKLRITSEEDVVVVKAAPGEKSAGAGGQQEPTQCADMVIGLPASTGPVLQEVPPVNTEGDGNKPGTTGNEQDRPESLEVPEAAAQIQELFIKTAGYPLPEGALKELAGYASEYVTQKIKMLENGKEKANAVGWLLEACREDYRHLPRAKKGKGKLPRPPGSSKEHDKYRELYRLV
ncbi:helix-turn-helix domain-containing protein [Neomoorella thermoacetica]|uniref:helix-turn-helix domain-containing protein n=2 Tax=Neomoorella thermoacetica TaxID=1525 RepID=UPI000321A0C2|nr:helix-turn-helix domain-containing protein [Moorella thermoacetica]